MIVELLTKINLRKADACTLLSYYFYKEDNEGFVLRYDDEGYLLAAFLYPKSQVERYPHYKEFIPEAYPDVLIKESLKGNYIEYPTIIDKIAQKLPNIVITKENHVFSSTLNSIYVEESNIQMLILKLYLISTYGEEVDFYIPEIDYDDRSKTDLHKYTSYQLFPIEGSCEDNYNTNKA